MKIRLLITLCCVSFLSDDVFAEGETEIKKGHYPFMAFIYYPDESIIEATGQRFIRGAILVKPEWLISSSVGPVMVNGRPIGFPRKTLLARLGSVSIDANFTLNEDEDEQEREVIQIVRPYNHSEDEWWRYDITLLRTLLPFNLTTAVGTATVRTKPGIIGNSNCFMLVYAVAKKIGNWTEEKVLMQLSVELVPPSPESCGSHFNEETMLCATDSDDIKNTAYDPEFCQGNSGGPLICENEVTGLQTYINNNCKPPHIYQLLSAWDNFITCGIEDKCSEEHCANMCTLINKDDPVIEENSSTSEEQAADVASVDLTKQTEEITMHSFITPELITEEYDTPTRIPTLTSAMEQQFTTDTTTTTTTTVATTTTTVATTPVTSPMTAETVHYEDRETSSWPRDKYPERSKHYEDGDMKMERKSNMEAQLQDLVTRPVKPRGAGDRNVSAPLSLLIQFVLASLII